MAQAACFKALDGSRCFGVNGYRIVVPARPSTLSWAFAMDVMMALRSLPALIKETAASTFGSMEDASKCP